MSTTLKQWHLRILDFFGRKHKIAKSRLGVPFVIYLGDFFSENPFYNRNANIPEILAMYALLKETENPVDYDIGDHSGFISSHLSQLLIDRNPKIFAFEPIPRTFCELNTAIRILKLQEVIYPFCLAVGESHQLVKIEYDRWN
ncbi:MAG: hypothetical protein D6732_05690 [Methanobacteriota archaeon]|nr:MAG: hypothetical protein D6732_05690 [Euryarchaeota archaeon]